MNAEEQENEADSPVPRPTRPFPTILSSKKLRDENKEVHELNLGPEDAESFDELFEQIDNVQISLQFIDELVKEVYDSCGSLHEHAPCLKCGSKFPNIVCMPCKHIVVCSSCVEAKCLESCPYCNFPLSGTEARHLTHDEVERILSRPARHVPQPTELEIRQFNLELLFNNYDPDVTGYIDRASMVDLLKTFRLSADGQKPPPTEAASAVQSQALKEAAKAKDRVWIDDFIAIATRMCEPVPLPELLAICDRLLKSSSSL